MTSAQCTAAWSADRLRDALSRRGWGELDGRANGGLRQVLTALVALLPYESAEGHVTAAQVADGAGMSVKWARHCMARLEDLGIITWSRGFLYQGRPRPGFVRIVKRRLAEIVRGLKDALDERRAQRRIDTHTRLETTLHATTIPPWRRRSRLSRRWELSSTLPTQGSTAPRAPAFRQPSQTLPGLEGDPMTTCQVCGRPEHQCRAADRRLPLRMQHDFTPGRASARALVAPAHVRTPDKHKAPRGWRAAAREAMHPTPTLFAEEGQQ